MSCAKTGAARVAVTMMKRVVGGQAALRGATCAQFSCSAQAPTYQAVSSQDRQCAYKASGLALLHKSDPSSKSACRRRQPSEQQPFQMSMP